MTAFKRFGFLLVCTALLIPKMSSAQTQGMTYEEYEAKLAQHQKRQAGTNKQVAECQAAGEQFRQQISDLNAQIAALEQEIYTLVDSDEQGLNDYFSQSDRVEQQLIGLLSLSDEALFDKRDEFDDISKLAKALKEKKIALLPDAQAKLKNINQFLERIDARMPRKRIKKYTVIRGDNLWKIAKLPVHYSDPYMWPRIYVENRTQIKDPDLIYPNWILNVPIGVGRDQHLVLSGQHLSSIAGIIYQDITKWHRIYQANKTQILHPSLVFPAQVLEIPAN